MAANIRHSSATAEHYTRAPEMALVRAVLGGIDLDPASSLKANQTVLAKHYFTKADDGMSKSWFGRVFLNPPGGTLAASKQVRKSDKAEAERLDALARRWGTRSSAVAWWRKLCLEHDEGRVSQGIFIGFSLEIVQTSQLAPASYQGRIRTPLEFTCCFPKTRLRFDGNSPTHASVIVYLGHDREGFRRVFSSLGRVTG